MLVNMKEILQDARKRRYGVGMFNTFTVEMALGVMQAAEELQAPVIIGTAEALLPCCDMELFLKMGKCLAERAGVPVGLHLDHGFTEKVIKTAIDSGFTSVMYDRSQAAYEDNVSSLREMADYAHRHGVSVEAELGHVVFDDPADIGYVYTKPEEVEDFVRRTRVDALAISIGTAHGVYKTPPVLELERLRAVRKVTDVGLVLHGGSGLSDEDFRNVVRDGIQKINIYTDVSNAASQAAFDWVKDHNRSIEQVSPQMRKASYEAAIRKLRLFNCEGKAQGYQGAVG